MKARRSMLLSIAAALIIATAQGALAHDFWDNWTGKPWHRGDPGSTHQLWELTENPGPQPSASFNPYGVALLTVTNGQYPDIVPGPDGLDVPTWHFGELVTGADGTVQEMPGTLDIFVPNSPIQNPVKLVYVQITTDKSTLNNQEPNTFPLAAGISHPGPIIKHGPGSWYTYNWLIEIRPNPEFERITFVFPYCTNISQVVVDSICAPVPEPSSLATLGASGLFTGMLSLRRRRR